jgi:deoxyribonuclease IV
VFFGGHCSGGVKKALDKAAEREFHAVQLFAQSPRAWRFPEHDPADLERFKERRPDSGQRAVLIHALYLLNLASPNDDLYEKSRRTLEKTVQTACAIDAEAVVFHVGSHLGAGLDAGLERVVEAVSGVLEYCSDTTWLLVENTAGAGGTIGRSVEELSLLFERLDSHPRLGLCLDSCHLFASGYDVTDEAALDALLDEVDGAIGLDRVRALHVNDSQAPLGSNRDRHANILDGLMGDKLGVFLANRRLQGLPAVLEVPGADGHGPNADEARKLRELHERWTAKAS